VALTHQALIDPTELAWHLTAPGRTQQGFLHRMFLQRGMASRH
jgi:hypothetical protein